MIGTITAATAHDVRLLVPLSKTGGSLCHTSSPTQLLAWRYINDRVPANQYRTEADLFLAIYPGIVQPDVDMGIKGLELPGDVFTMLGLDKDGLLKGVAQNVQWTGCASAITFVFHKVFPVIGLWIYLWIWNIYKLAFDKDEDYGTLETRSGKRADWEEDDNQSKEEKAGSWSRVS